MTSSSCVHPQALAVYGFRQRTIRRVEAAGHAYESDVVRDLLALRLSPHPVLKVDLVDPDRENSSSPECDENVSISDLMDKDEQRYMRYMAKLDPNNWKEQDHYRVLGLSKLRYKATPAQIKNRAKVLMYHPDKGKLTRKGCRNETMFACIQKAFEQLGDETSKLAYDSVDPNFDESYPEPIDVKKEEFFYEVFEPFFDRHSRFSVVQPVPQLGGAESTRDELAHFYDFWLHFNSCREFSYKDAESKDKAEDRYERREIEKQNRIEREKLRKEYLRKLLAAVELSYSKDPRIKAFREEDKREKEAEKARKKAERDRKQKEQQEAEAREQEKLEKERQEKREQEKKDLQERQKVRKTVQAARKKLRDLCKAKSFFTADPSLQLKVMEAMERVILSVGLEALSQIVIDLEEVTDVDEALFTMNEHAKPTTPENGKPAPKQTAPQSVSTQPAKWTHEEIQLLIKACNLYPAGSVERWVQVTRYLTEHASTPPEKPRTEKDVIKQAKIMKSMEASAAFANVEPGPSTVPGLNAAPTVKAEVTPAVPEEEKWSPEQQKQLEAALKSVGAKDPQRWEKIAEKVEGKTKKQCMQRYKKLVQMIKESKQQS